MKYERNLKKSDFQENVLNQIFLFFKIENIFFAKETNFYFELAKRVQTNAF